MAPEELRECFMQDMWPLGITPKVRQNPTFLRPVGWPTIYGRIRSSMERPIPRLPGCGQGVEGLHK